MKKLPLPLNLEAVTGRLKGVICPDYQWPEVPAGWQLEFVAYPDGFVIMDVLHPISGAWLSEDHEDGILDQPMKHNGEPLSAQVLQKAGIPFMTTFATAAVSNEPKELHLSVVKQ